MNIFISYSHEDRVLAGEIKTYFTFSFGFNVFLAHEDIEPTQAWEDEILSNLRSCNVFIPIITEHYYNSVWTDQETGFVLGRDVLIISIKVGTNPRGFIKRYQAYVHQTVGSTCKKVLKIIVKNANLREDALNSLLRKFGTSYSYDNAGDIINMILEFESDLSTMQKNELLILAESNSQIYGSYNARYRLLRFIRKNEEELEEEIINRYKERI